MSRQEIHFGLKDTALRDDVHQLGELVGEMLREQGGDALFDAVEGDRQMALARRENPEATVQLVLRTRGRDARDARDMVRAFSTWFQMVNTAEKVHRIRRRRHYMQDDSRAQPGGIDEALQKLKAQGLSLDDIRKLFQALWIEPVLAAHPTESKRRTILRKQQLIAELLFNRLDLPPKAHEARNNWERLRTEITTGWQTADNSRDRLTVADEREHVLFFVVEVLYKIIPIFYEEIEAAMLRVFGDAAAGFEVPEIIRFGSWVGGDMDSNPEVTAKTIRETITRHHQLIINSYFLECQQLSELLSQSAARIGIAAEMQAQIDAYAVRLASVSTNSAARQDYMPYRVFLQQIAERLRATYEARQSRYESAGELLHDLQLIVNSLRQHRGTHAGLFHVRRLIRRVRTFGFHLATLDLRQHAEVHRSVIAHGFADSAWAEKSAADRTTRLCQAIADDSGPVNALDPAGKRSIWVFESIAHCRHRHGPDAIGPFVVSGAQGADDLLSVLLLARWADTADRRTGDVGVDVAPLFETEDQLERCGDIMTALLATRVYQRHLIGRRNHQFVMLGYASSNKEGGTVRAQWLMRRAQEALLKVAADAKVDLTIFHGRGNTSIRNATMVDGLLRTMPANGVGGRVRMTEQGELIHDKYSLRPIALRVFERAFNSLSLAHAQVLPAEQVKPEWREVMELMMQVSATSYRRLVYEDPQFFAFFRRATPVDVIERMQIGSQGNWREPPASVAATRTIPWSYAWAQSRYMLPSWYGAGVALQAASDKFGDAMLADMFSNWYFFAALVNNAEMGMARADLEIAHYYDELAGAETGAIAARIRGEYTLACERVLRLKGGTELLEADPVMQRNIRLRNPYLAPMHLMQVDLLARWRDGGCLDRELLQALLASVNGIGQGLQGSI